MSNFSFSSALKITAFDFKNNRRQIFGWSIAIFAIMFMYMILFPSMQEMATIKMDAMPKEFMQFFGMESLSDMSNFISYFGMIFNLILIALSIFAATFAANLIYREEKTKTIEFLYSLEVSRIEIYVSKVITALIAVILVVLSAALSTAICGIINGGETFVASNFLKIVKISSFTVFFFMAISLMIAGVTTRIGAPSIGGMIVLFSYFIGYLSILLETKAEWLSYLSPFQLFSPENAVAFEKHTLYNFAIYFVISVLLIIAGAVSYKNRDFNI